MFQVDPNQLAAASQARVDGGTRVHAALTEEDFRRQEYEILSSDSGTPLDELFTEQLDGSRYGWLAPYVRRVGLVRKLRETRVLVGFSRLMPKTERRDEGVQSLAIDPDMRWLPAIEVRGEGIFVELHQDTIDRWLTQVATSQRTTDLIREYNLRRVTRQLAVRNVDARHMMLHTLAHAVIKELTFSCGYGSAALRERLYCNLEDPERPMNGFLVYTASGDSEGTLGGLVAQSHPGRFERMIGDALHRSSWCSNDPVCMESPGTGSFSSNLAACHGCILLPETSCEEGNRLLDRALLVGTVDEPAIGLFGKDPSFCPA